MKNAEAIAEELLDKTKPLRKAKKDELTSEILEQVKDKNVKVWIGDLESEKLADELGLDFEKGVKITMNGNALQHIEKRHGVNSTPAKNGQPSISESDYINHDVIVNNADKRKTILTQDNQKVLVSGKQVNGYYVVVESISTKDNELKLKTMYKENGSLENSSVFKENEPLRDRQSGGESLRVNLSNTLDSNGSNNIIPQMPKDNSEPEKVLEYFRDDLIRDYDEALETFGGKRPLVSTIPYKALRPITEAREALVKEANDGFKKILQKAGFPDVIQEKFMESLRFDIDYNLPRIRQYFGHIEKELHQYDETHKPMAEKLLKQKDEVIRLYESRLPAEQELEKKRILLSEFMENARVYGSKEHKLLDNFIDEIEAKRSLESTQTPPAPKWLFDEVDSSDIIFTDKKGKEHTLTKEVQEQWCETFNLKSLDEAYTPKFSDEVSKALEPILQGEQIKLTSGSLLKLMQRDRLEFLPYIKDTLEYSDIVIKDKENALIFAKDIGQTSYFTSVSKNDKGEWVISTNSYKTINQLKNRVNDSGEILYISKEAPNILAETFTTKAFSNELASDIIPQTTLESTMQKFNYDERKAKDLLEWHKHSSPLTKDENGVPKAENMLESGNKILGETMTLKDRLLIDNKIKYSYLKEIAQDLPKPITKDDFLHLLKNKKYVNIQTPIKELEIEPLKAYEHLTQNSNKQNRIDISGAILPTLQNPLFITKDKKRHLLFLQTF